MRSAQTRTIILHVVPISVLLVLGQAVQADETGAAAEKMAEQMLTAIGGRQAWAELKNTINGSQQNRAEEPTVVNAVITMDFEYPRFRIETTAQGLHLIRVINGDKHWRLRRRALGLRARWHTPSTLGLWRRWDLACGNQMANG